jgi:hypothetical protein
VAEVGRQKISLGAVLGSTSILDVARGTVRIGCVDEFQVATVQRNREVLAEIFFKVFNERVRLTAEVRPASSGPPEKPEGSQADEEHPVIRALRKELGAEPL